MPSTIFGLGSCQLSMKYYLTKMPKYAKSSVLTGNDKTLSLSIIRRLIYKFKRFFCVNYI